MCVVKSSFIVHEEEHTFFIAHQLNSQTKMAVPINQFLNSHFSHTTKAESKSRVKNYWKKNFGDFSQNGESENEDDNWGDSVFFIMCLHGIL